MIKFADPEHNEALLELAQAFFQEIVDEYDNLDITYNVPPLGVITDLDETKDFLHGAFVNGKLVGFCIYGIDDEYHNTMMIKYLFVSKDYRRRGFASDLVDRVFAETRKLGYDWKVCVGHLANSKAKPFYAKYNFVHETFSFYTSNVLSV